MKAIHFWFGSHRRLTTMAGMACLFAAGCGSGTESSRAGGGRLPIYSASKGGATAATTPVNTAGLPAAGGTTSPATTAAAGTTAVAGATAAGTTATGGVTAVVGGTTLTGGASAAGGNTASTATTALPDAGVPDVYPRDIDARVPDAPDAAVDAAPRTDLAGEAGVSGACGASNWNSVFDVSSISGATIDQNGNVFATAKFFDTMDFGAGPIISAGSADIALIKFAPTGKALWSKRYGDESDQIPAGIALTKSGLIALSGTFSGTLTLKNSAINTGEEPIDFLGVVDAEGAGLWVKGIDTKSGSISGVASNPAEDAFAVCGYTLGAATDLVPGALAAGDGLEDILLAKINATTGAVIWSRQVGGAGSQICKAVAVDAAGDVYATGLFSGTLDLGKGALALVPPNNARAIWVAKFDGATGAAKSNQAWGNDLKQSIKSLTLDSAGNVAIAGAMRGVLTIGSSTLATLASKPGSDAGAAAARTVTDAYAIKLDSNLTPLWARSWGDASGLNQEARSVAFLAGGDLLVAGSMRGTIDPDVGIPALTAVTGADFYKNPQTDPFWIRLRGGDGTALCAQRYGDQYGQSADFLVTNPFGTGANAILIGGFQGTIDFGLGLLVAPGIGSTVPKTQSYLLGLAGL